LPWFYRANRVRVILGTPRIFNREPTESEDSTRSPLQEAMLYFVVFSGTIRKARWKSASQIEIEVTKLPRALANRVVGTEEPTP
jgi:hypothetical protein